MPKVAVAEEVVFDSAPLSLDGTNDIIAYLDMRKQKMWDEYEKEFWGIDKAEGKSKTFTWVVETDLKGGDNGTSKS